MQYNVSILICRFPHGCGSSGLFFSWNGRARKQLPRDEVSTSPCGCACGVHHCFGFQLLDCKFSQCGSAGNFSYCSACRLVLVCLTNIVHNKKDASPACGGLGASACYRNFHKYYSSGRWGEWEECLYVGEGDPKLEDLLVWDLSLLLTQSIQLSCAVSVCRCGKCHPLFFFLTVHWDWHSHF